MEAVAGAGAAAINLNDLSVPNGKSTLSLGIDNKNDAVQVQGSAAVTSIYDDFAIVSLASGHNLFSFQDQAGETRFYGAVKVNLGPGPDTLNVAADSAHDTGVTNAIVKFFSSTAFDGGPGTDSLFEGTENTNLFFAAGSQVTNF